MAGRGRGSSIPLLFLSWTAAYPTGIVNLPPRAPPSPSIKHSSVSDHTDWRRRTVAELMTGRTANFLLTNLTKQAFGYMVVGKNLWRRLFDEKGMYVCTFPRTLATRCFMCANQCIWHKRRSCYPQAQIITRRGNTPIEQATP